MIETADRGDMDAALRHGWQALSAARSERSREAEMLVNLAKLCEEAGYPEAALGGYTAVLARTSAPRLRLPALAGTASVSGRLRDQARVADAARRIAEESSEAFPFEASRAWLAVGRAHRALGDDDAANAATARAAALARAHGFHEISHRAEQETVAVRAPLTPGGLEVIRTLETWSEDPPLGHAVSTSSRG
jgi:tetratricopeptide (TPR) repeat protein